MNANFSRSSFSSVLQLLSCAFTTALIFASGKMVVTGAMSENSRLASRKYARIVQRLGFDAKFPRVKIQNIVVKFPIRLEGLVYSHIVQQL